MTAQASGWEVESAMQETSVWTWAHSDGADGHSWVTAADMSLTALAWCQWCGVHRSEVTDWTDNPQCRAIAAIRALAVPPAPEAAPRDAVEAMREAAAQVACRWCRDGHEPERDALNAYHLGPYTGHVMHMCYAALIRALPVPAPSGPPSTGEEQRIADAMCAPPSGPALPSQEAIAEVLHECYYQGTHAPLWNERSDDDRHDFRDMARAVLALFAAPSGPGQAGDSALRERVAVAIEQAHWPQSVGSHSRALWLADAVLAALAGSAEAETPQRVGTAPGWKAAYDYDGPVSVGGLAADLGMLEPPPEKAEAERAVVEAAKKAATLAPHVWLVKDAILGDSIHAGWHVHAQHNEKECGEHGGRCGLVAALRAQPAPDQRRAGGER